MTNQSNLQAYIRVAVQAAHIHDGIDKEFAQRLAEVRKRHQQYGLTDEEIESDVAQERVMLESHRKTVVNNVMARLRKI